MSSVESAKTGFFPNNTTGKTATKKSGDVGKAAPLTRNDPVRKTELEKSAQADAKVAINDAVKDFARIKKVADSTGPVDNSAKIAALKQQIQDGTYNIDYDGLADKMLASEF